MKKIQSPLPVRTTDDMALFPFSNSNRRDFLKLSAGLVLSAAFSTLPAMAGPFTREDFEHLVPADKKLAPDWVKSLFERGSPEVLRDGNLKFVGMPIGGIGAGQVYLGGDGRLWHWDIFNLPQKMDKGSDFHYRNPLDPVSPFEQGFAIRAKIGQRVLTRKMQRGEWSDISFRGEYPIARVKYADATAPLSVTLEAFSPFIPLNADDSSLPATIMEFTVHNSGTETIQVEFCGWLENAVGFNSAKNYVGKRTNQIRRDGDSVILDCAASESPPGHAEHPFANEADFGSMSLALLETGNADSGNASVSLDNIFDETGGQNEKATSLEDRLIGSLGRKIRLKGGGSSKITFVLAWHFPNLSMDKLGRVGHHYAKRFGNAATVAGYVAANYLRLAGQTKSWSQTWYDSTLPFWFLDRTFLNTSILATSTCLRFANGRFYGWEGVGCCPGTCGHVYNYAHAIARLFPELERATREKVDFGPALQPDGAIHFRGEFNDFPAVDGQAGTILRALREHQMSADGEFLKRNWPAIKRATGWLIAKDANSDGLIESNQHNTLDTDWFGPVAWLSGLYLAALLAAAQMADESGDAEFALKCRSIVETGRKNFVTQLFDGEYFINKVDPKHLDAINSGTGCEIDQVLGQSWAFQVGLPRVLPKKETGSALKSLWRYNFSPDVGAYRNINKPGRWYAVAGEAGLLMCTFPRRDWDYARAKGNGPEWAAGYFNECMNGFEYQAAAHMISEGLVLEGLAVTRAVHDRYHASRRNPWNEIECGDHYARSMASYGVYLAACGFEYHGPNGHIGFAPKISPKDFKCAFTSAEGWGIFSQKIEHGKLEAKIAAHWGKVRLKTVSLEIGNDTSVSTAIVSPGKAGITSGLNVAGNRALITFSEPLELVPETDLHLTLA